MKKFAYIDALRGYAILGVLLVHTSQYCGFGTQAAFGARGVQLFFVASALTLMMSWNERNDGVRAFFIRRLFRIAPMFWIMIGVDVLQSSTPLDWAEIAGAGAFLQDIRPDWITAPIVMGGWSVSAEVMFYLMFPLLAAFVTNLRRATMLLIIAVLISYAWKAFGFDIASHLFPRAAPPDVDAFRFLALPTHLPAFAAGILAYHLLPVLLPASSPKIMETVLIGALIAIAYFARAHDDDIRAFSLLFATVAICLAAGAGRYLTGSMIQHIGKVSFSTYLLHFHGIAVAFAAAKYFELAGASAFAFLFVFATALTTVVATLTYLCIEMPMIRLGKRFAARALTVLRTSAT